MIAIPETMTFYRYNTDVDNTLELIGHGDDTPAAGPVIVDGRYTDLQFEVYNADASDALADFELQVKVHASGDWVIAYTGTAWATIGNILVFKSANLNTLAAQTRAFARVNLGPVYAFQFKAKSAGTNTGVYISGYVRG